MVYEDNNYTFTNWHSDVSRFVTEWQHSRLCLKTTQNFRILKNSTFLSIPLWILGSLNQAEPSQEFQLLKLVFFSSSVPWEAGLCSGKDHGLWSPPAGVWIPALLLISWVTLVKFLNFSCSQFIYKIRKMRDFS